MILIFDLIFLRKILKKIKIIFNFFSPTLKSTIMYFGSIFSAIKTAGSAGPASCPLNIGCCAVIMGSCIIALPHPLLLRFLRTVEQYIFGGVEPSRVFVLYGMAKQSLRGFVFRYRFLTLQQTPVTSEEGGGGRKCH